MEKFEKLEEEIKEIIRVNIGSDDFYCGILGVNEATNKIIDLLKNEYMISNKNDDFCYDDFEW